MVYIGAGEAPDEYEYPKPDLNFTTKYKISGIEFSFKIKNYLKSGEVYQINYTQPISLELIGKKRILINLPFRYIYLTSASVSLGVISVLNLFDIF